MTRLEIWDAIVEYGIATEEELELVTAINGFHDDALNDVIYVRTGYRNIKQLVEDWEGKVKPWQNNLWKIGNNKH